MRHRISLIVTLVAWLLATGSHWDLVQTFAWGRMIANYSQTMSLSAAVAKTFSPRTMCRLCHAVAKAKQHETSEPFAPNSKAPGKIVLVLAPSTIVALGRTPTLIGMLGRLQPPVSVNRAAPLLPPPRDLA